eukprot:CAMPEP_0117641454 /NCGR_PEP_ID=MMETSP0802-20121206/9359_1 /TAXON_ID=38833 /ORGANISM="Micromonas sp., Strain CCMP2099" /LENGTH=33 /DNA_ID= /DNA_START= /DNA_END= /DNA_ORIENTATION=
MAFIPGDRATPADRDAPASRIRDRSSPPRARSL